MAMLNRLADTGRAVLTVARRILPWHSARLHLVFDPRYTYEVSGVPMDGHRAEKILAHLLSHGLAERRALSRPLAASMANLRLVHRDGYLESLQDPAVVSAIFGQELGPAQAEAAVELHRLQTGGTIQATRLALRSAIPAANLGGGFHHAGPDRGMGFCLYNDVAVAIARLRRKGYGEPILVVDLDLHDGNGTREVFAADPTVHTFSIHNEDWNVIPAVADSAIALGANVTDDEYLAILRRELPPVIRSHKPGLVIYLAGSDPAGTDELGNWRITASGMITRDQLVVDMLRRLRPGSALAVVLAGGYGPEAWRYSARFLSWLAHGKVVEPPGTASTARSLGPQIASLLRDPSAAAPDEVWQLSEDDLPGIAGVATAEGRVLGRYTRQGIELLFEQAGLLQKLRDKGFSSLSVGLSQTSSELPTITVHDGPNLLMELRIKRSRRVVPRHEVLFVDWLLLQDPSASFSPARPRLPGQQHPGLGLLGETAGVLLGIAHSLKLAGVAFVPANYYMAVLGSHHLRFLDPAMQALLQRLTDLLAGLSLAEASEALANGRIIDRATGESFEWQPATMVIPDGPVMTALVDSAEYHNEVSQAREKIHLTLLPAS